MFEQCYSLVSLPNLPKWNLFNVADMSYMFKGCNSLISLPDTSKWKTENITEVFDGCFNSLNIHHLYK